jgi:hypothetical protein
MKIQIVGAVIVALLIIQVVRSQNALNVPTHPAIVSDSCGTETV